MGTYLQRLTVPFDLILDPIVLQWKAFDFSWLLLLRIDSRLCMVRGMSGISFPNFAGAMGLINGLQSAAEMCCKKLGEESVELIIATLGNNKEEMKNEAADLIYHLLVLLKSKNVEFKDVINVLEKRMNVSGIEEKKNRSG